MADATHFDAPHPDERYRYQIFRNTEARNALARDLRAARKESPVIARLLLRRINAVRATLKASSRLVVDG